MIENFISYIFCGIFEIMIDSMKIKALLISTILIYPLMFQSVVNASCGTITAAEVSQFAQTHSDE